MCKNNRFTRLIQVTIHSASTPIFLETEDQIYTYHVRRDLMGETKVQSLFRTQSGNECIPHSRISQPTTTWLYSPYLSFSQTMTQLRTIIYFLPMFWNSFCFAWSNSVYIHFNAVSNHIQMHEIFKLVWWVFKFT